MCSNRKQNMYNLRQKSLHVIPRALLTVDGICQMRYVKMGPLLFIRTFVNINIFDSSKSFHTKNLINRNMSGSSDEDDYMSDAFLAKT